MEPTKERKIVIAEDNLEMSRMYERAFKFYGYEVEIAHDGEMALNTLITGEGELSAIILDIMMPKMNGLEVLKILRKDDRFKRVPIAVLTNSFNKEEASDFLGVGADLYLVKIEHTAEKIVEKMADLIKASEEATKS